MTRNLDPREIADTSVRRRQPQALNHSSAKRLLAYASVAGASLAFAQSASAEVVYTPVRTALFPRYALDLNHDGIIDFRIFGNAVSNYASLEVEPAVKGNRIRSAHSGGCAPRLAAGALPVGSVIGPTASFTKAASCMFEGYSGGYDGPWVDMQHHYLGLAFVIDGKMHFGWARISVSSNCSIECRARIEGYAYETEPGKPIIAGDQVGSADAEVVPGSLGALALGAASHTDSATATKTETPR